MTSISNAYLSDKLHLRHSLTLEKALTIAGQMEAAVKYATLLSSTDLVLTATVQAMEVVNTFS